MADAGVYPFTLARILGHSNTQMRAQYTHATDSAIRSAVENLVVNSDFSTGLVTDDNLRNVGRKLLILMVAGE